MFTNFTTIKGFSTSIYHDHRPFFLFRDRWSWSEFYINTVIFVVNGTYAALSRSVVQLTQLGANIDLCHDMFTFLHYTDFWIKTHSNNPI